MSDRFWLTWRDFTEMPSMSSADILGCAPVRSARESFDLHATKLIQFYKNELRSESERKAFAENLETRVYLGLSKFNKSTIAVSIMAGENLSAEQQRLVFATSREH